MLLLLPRNNTKTGTQKNKIRTGGEQPEDTFLRPSCVWVPTDGGLCGYNERTVTKALRNSGRRVACGTAHDVTDEFEGI